MNDLGWGESDIGAAGRTKLCALLVSSAIAWGCGSSDLATSSDQEVVGLQDAQTVMSFDSIDGWRVNGAVLQSASEHVQGAAALAVPVHQRTSLTSAPFEFTRTPNAVELSLHGSLSGGKARGTISASIECAELDLKRFELPARNLSDLDHDAHGFARVRFTIPPAVQDKLSGGCPQLLIGLELESALPGRFVLDDLGLRAATPPITLDSTPLCGLSGKTELVERAVETPEGHWDYQSWLASPATQRSFRFCTRSCQRTET